MQHDQTYERERKNLIEEEEKTKNQWAAETEKVFMNPSEDDNDDVGISDDIQDK
jgi:hypothetical protein